MSSPSSFTVKSEITATVLSSFSVYEFENDVTIEQVGFVELDEYVGCSPDGLIGTGGGLQLKCKMDREHLKQVIYGDDEIDSAHVWQMQMEMLVTGRKWWDYVCYNGL